MNLEEVLKQEESVKEEIMRVERKLIQLKTKLAEINKKRMRLLVAEGQRTLKEFYKEEETNENKHKI